MPAELCNDDTPRNTYVWRYLRYVYTRAVFTNIKEYGYSAHCVGLLMLVGVLLFGLVQGAQRWLDLGVTASSRQS